MTSRAFYVLDLDRCMGNDHIFELVDTVARELPGVDHEALERARQAIEASGGSFNLFEALGEMGVSPKVFIDAYEQRAAGYDYEFFRSPGATRLLQALETNRLPYMIMTYGGLEWQGAKLRATGFYQVPHDIVSTKRKSDIINEWYNPDRKVFVPLVDGVEAHTVVLVDDKAKAFEALIPQARGYWLRASDTLLVSQMGEVGENVMIVRSLDEVTAGIA